MNKSDIVAVCNSWTTVLYTKREWAIIEKTDDAKGTQMESFIDPEFLFDRDCATHAAVHKIWDDGEMSDEAYHLAMYLLLSEGK